MNVEHTDEIAVAKGMPRRAIVKSAAWSLPVFAAVAVTPAFAASGVPVITSLSLVASRRNENPAKTVDFTWNVSWAPTSGVSSGSVSYSQVGFTSVTGPGTINTSILFTAIETDANALVPSITLSVSFTYNGVARVATFTTAEFEVKKGATTAEPITVLPEASNPVTTS